MAPLIWTHPTHKTVALVATLCNALGLFVCVCSIVVVPWFTSERDKPYRKHYFLDTDVDCSHDLCLESLAGKLATWQKVALYLIFVGSILNLLTCVVLILVFWPFALKNKVLNPVLDTCRTVDFFGAFIKYSGAWVYVLHAHEISYNFAWWKDDRCLKLEYLPISMIFVSFILQFLSCMFMTVATDVRARTGGETHRERLGLDETAQKHELELQELHPRVSYIPDQKESHQRLLSQIELSKKAGR